MLTNPPGELIARTPTMSCEGPAAYGDL